MCHTANIAIRDAVEYGVLRNVSVMVPAPAFSEAAQILSEMHNVTIGLHVDLTAEWEHLRWGSVLPRKQVYSLVDSQGLFFKSCHELEKAGANLDHMKQEVRSQLDIARKAGLNIKYVDEHMGVGNVNGLGEWLVEMCHQQGLVCNRQLTNYGKLKRLPYSERGVNIVQAVIDGLSGVPEGTYLLVGHPSYVTAEMQAAYLPGQKPGDEVINRDWQRRMFMEDAILQFFAENNVQPISYVDV
jgi:hypothetical protein